jgi:predicted Zn-dependent protease
MKCLILPSFLAIASGAAIFSSSCSTVPDTGRKQISLIPESKTKALGLSTFQKYNQELEADQLGALYMARAGYDPRESIGLWERFSRFKGKSGTPQFMSTHPSDAKRIERLKAYMPQVMPIYEQNR